MTMHTNAHQPTPEAAWFKSSYSDGEGLNCLEVAHRAESIGVRDSKNPQGPALLLPLPAWKAFLTSVVES
ncbi:DUF397 domain-containing protein [Streptomyces flavofungini]|uniref:DUF397 domain-containing protein n=1 Tax=Streptomyces flavofungini TaxID=68200 RepID=UPI0025B10235|nr:DUF397 domain-containing protein [Streptomyces flavofungini]WJV46096.1 DUF397 domain-containing protein [Streptomyces flavofungini]